MLKIFKKKAENAEAEAVAPVGAAAPVASLGGLNVVQPSRPAAPPPAALSPVQIGSSAPVGIGSAPVGIGSAPVSIGSIGSGASGLNVMQPQSPSAPAPVQIGGSAPVSIGGGSAPVGIGGGSAPIGIGSAPVSIGGGSPIGIGSAPVGIGSSPAAAPTTPATLTAPAMSAGNGRGLTRGSIEEVLDNRVRPGLLSDGGNIELVDIQDGKILVKLVGACGTCPSSAMTMQFGIERILREEFPEMTGLVNLSF